MIGSVEAVAPNPTKTNEYAFGKITSGPVAKLYKGTSALNSATGTLLTSTSYQDIDDVQYTPDGAYIIYKADTGTGYKLYRIPAAGGSPVVLDTVFEFSVSPVSGSHKLVYSKDLGTTSEIFTMDYTTASSTQITTLGSDVYNPSWSRDGNTILFSFIAAAATNADLYSVPAAGGSVTQVTNTPNEYEYLGMYNEDATKIATIYADSTFAMNLGVYDISGSSLGSILADTSLGINCYWTDSNGRAVRINMPHFHIGPRKRTR